MAAFTPDTSNKLFQLVSDLINQTSRNIFLTGKAGTGKTTFLKFIRESCPKQKVILAPTGVAAINAGGATIHSFFQFPLSPFIPSARGTGFRQDQQETVNQHSLISRLRYNNEKRKVLQQLELLIIDEISMVRCDLLDAVDTVLRHFRRRPHERFGGVQVLFIGDMFQLPPVVKDTDWQLLNGFYESPYFFSSQVLKDEPPVYIEFEKIYRQSDEKFIRLLNQVRNNELDEYGLQLLDKLFRPAVKRSKDDGYIILTTHNEQARNINMNALNELSGQAMQFNAEIKGDFPSNSYPAEETLYLKAGAQVMFIKNDTADRGKRYFNGKIGTVTRLEEKKVFVSCQDEVADIEVEKESWENIRYTLDKTSQGLKEEVLGSFSQFPLRLAWAITIHKSQGLTFDKAIIDAGEAFAPGQVYVALSRCTSLEGLVLKSRLQTGRLFTDKRIVAFSQSISSSSKLQRELEQAKDQYQQQMILSAFDFSAVINSCADMREYLLEHQSSFNEDAVAWADKLAARINGVQQVAVKFHVWLKEQFALPLKPEENKALQERAIRAAAHFNNETSEAIQFLLQSPIVTDNKQHAKEYNDQLKSIFAQLSVLRHRFRVFDGSFDPAVWHQHRNSFVLPSFPVNAYGGASPAAAAHPHPLLHKKLRELRDSICSVKDLPLYLVAGSTTIDEMARYLPQSLAELKKINGFGDTKISQYGEQFLETILQYSKENDLVSLIDQKKPKRERKPQTGKQKGKPDTFAESFRLFKEGKGITDIAKERNLAVSTIEGHISRYMASGEIKIEEVLSKEKTDLIAEALKDYDGKTITSIKEKLGEAVSFGEIRMTIAALPPREPNG